MTKLFNDQIVILGVLHPLPMHSVSSRLEGRKPSAVNNNNDGDY